MSWRGSASRFLSNGSLPLPYDSSHHQPLFEEGGDGIVGNHTMSSSSSPRPSLQEDFSCHISLAGTVGLVVSYCLIMLLGLVGNCFLICIIARHRERANVTSILIANLSVSDILMCAFCLPFSVTYTLMDHWVFGIVLCKLVPFIQCASVTVSVLSLVLIALERHQLIIHPAGWKPSIPQAYASVVLIWILACLTSLPFLTFHWLTTEPYTNLPKPRAQSHQPRHPLFTPSSLHPQQIRPSLHPQQQTHPSLQPQLQFLAPILPHEPSPNPRPPSPLWPSPPPHPPPYSHPSPSPAKRFFPSPELSRTPPPTRYPFAPPHLEACVDHWPSQEHKLAYTTWLLLFQYCGPLLLVLLCYVRVFVRLRRRRNMLDRARTTENQRLSHSRRINVMLVALVAAFTVCWLPLTVFNVVYDWYHEALPVCHHNLLFSLCHLLAMFSTCVNPVIYGFLNSNFRQEVREGLLHCRCRPVEDNYEQFPLSTVHMEVSRTSLRLNYRNNSV